MSPRWGAAVVVLGVLLTACSDATEPQAAATAACREIERPPRQEGSHLIGTTAPPVPYSSNPPTSGWHVSGQGPASGVYGVEVPPQQLVSVLEQGGVVVAHRDPLTPEELATATSLVGEVERLVVTRHDLDAEDPPVALAAWGVLQRCDELVAEDVVAFARAHGGVDQEQP